MARGTSSDGVLLDTCAAIWIVENARLAAPARRAILHAARANAVFVPVVIAWEIGLLSRPRADGSPRVRFIPDPKRWFANLMAQPGISPAPLTPEIAIDAWHLPGELHGDPADRMIVATARHLGLPVVTRDRKIIAYADAGYVDAIPC